MRHDPPWIELLDEVIRFLRDASTPAVAEQRIFHGRIAANVLELVKREISLGDAADAREWKRLAALLGFQGDLPTLNKALCERLADGTWDLEMPAVAAHLWLTVLDTVAIESPGYSTFQAHCDGSAQTLGRPESPVR